jgi:hypothetical protein
MRLSLLAPRMTCLWLLHCPSSLSHYLLVEDGLFLEEIMYFDCYLLQGVAV